MKKASVSGFIKNLMGDIDACEQENNRPLGLEVSAGLLSYITTKRAGGTYSRKRPILDSQVEDLLNGLLIKIEKFSNQEGMENKIVADLLLRKMMKFGRLQVQNPQRFEPKAKMTGQE